MLWLLIYCFRGKKSRGNIHIEKIVLTDFVLIFFKALTHAFDRADQTTERGMFQAWVLRDFFHESILPVKVYQTINFSRNIFPIAKSFGCPYHSNFMRSLQ